MTPLVTPSQCNARVMLKKKTARVRVVNPSFFFEKGLDFIHSPVTSIPLNRAPAIKEKNT